MMEEDEALRGSSERVAVTGDRIMSAENVETGRSLRDGTVRQHFVEFLSPGTFVAESSTVQLASWDIEAAKQLARGIKERHGATPYGFRFLTRERGPADLDSHIAHRSHMYYLGGRVETLADVEARNDPKESILRSNMRGNGYERIIINENSWRWTQPLDKDDVVLEWDNLAAGERPTSQAPVPISESTETPTEPRRASPTPPPKDSQ